MSTEIGLSPRTSRITPTTTPTATAAAPPAMIGSNRVHHPAASQPRTYAAAGRVASSAPLRPPSRVLRDSGSTVRSTPTACQTKAILASTEGRPVPRGPPPAYPAEYLEPREHPPTLTDGA